MHRPKSRTFLSFLSLTSIFFSTLISPGRASAQDLVANEDLAGGSSVFVFKDGRKKPQSHSNLRVKPRGDRARASRISANSSAAAQRRRDAAIVRRKIRLTAQIAKPRWPPR